MKPFSRRKAAYASKPVVWIDFENAPHVWVLDPIVKYLKRDYRIISTARDFSYTVGLCRQLGYDAKIIGLKGYGKNAFLKAIKLLHRSILLFRYFFFKKNNICLALSHGSRSQILAAYMLNIPVITLDDYEFSNQSLTRFVDHLLVPFPIPKNIWGRYKHKIEHYPGLKEEIYLHGFKPKDLKIPELEDNKLVKILFRPEGQFAHYHSENSALLQKAILKHLTQFSDILLILLPRDKTQGDEIIHFCNHYKMKYYFPQNVLSGPEFIYMMDMIIGGGGTMTREAAVLGVPSYSFFSGKWGAVDRYMESKGKICRISSFEDVSKIIIKKRNPNNININNNALNHITGFVEKVIKKEKNMALKGFRTDP